MASKDRDLFEHLVAKVRDRLRAQKSALGLPVRLLQKDTALASTGGWYVELAQLPETRVTCELWFDRWTARSARTLWYGFTGPIPAITSLEASMRAEFGDPVRFTDDNVEKDRNRLSAMVPDAQLGGFFLELRIPA